ncbi:MAG: hypothetical protein ABR568_18030 [Pyrinomonadaceae bacterium]
MNKIYRNHSGGRRRQRAFYLVQPSGRYGEPFSYATLTTMEKRARSITVISWIFIALGSIGFLASLLPYLDADPAQSIAYLKAHWMVHVARILAVASGVFMLYGFNWARLLLVVWIGFHIVISALHSTLQLLMHSVLFAVILYFLFRPQASAYFRGTREKLPQIPS